MYLATADSSGNYKGELCPYGPLELMPSAQVLNYGQVILEGLKAQTSAKGRVVLFRPDCHAERIEEGAVRMTMPPIPRQMFIDVVKQVVKSNSDMARSLQHDQRP